MSVADHVRQPGSLPRHGYNLVQQLYDGTLRPRLPPKQVQLGGVETYAGAILDRTLVDDEHYEEEMRTAQEQHIEQGDRVRIVGGGRGVTAVRAVQLGAEDVEVIEAAKRAVDIVSQAAELNDATDRITVYHGHIGKVHVPWGARLGPAVTPEWCRSCDILELDCEGAELDILAALDAEQPLPRAILVETHRLVGLSSEAARKELQRLGYEIVSEVDESSDVTILSATRER